MASEKVIMPESTLKDRVKTTTLAQEVYSRLRNTSIEVEDEVKGVILTKLMT